MPLATEALTDYSGQFGSDELLASYTIAVQDGKLMLQEIQNGDGFMRSPQHLILRAVAVDTFAVDEEGLQFRFKRDDKNRVNGFSLDAGRTKGLVFYRK